jgi:2-isopropylmalate synthase
MSLVSSSESEKSSGTAPAEGKYRPYHLSFETDLPDRSWPSRIIKAAPDWCSVDLRDGNQALPNPMTVAQKLIFFDLLKEIGFKQIEIGYPVASKAEFEFTRALIEEGRIPRDVVPQVLIAADPGLISRTFDAIVGGPQTIVHIYNSTSVVQRERVYKMSKDETIARAVRATAVVRQLADRADLPVILQYSPESFTGTEREFARDVCNAVIDEWIPSPDRKIIINLPSTVEMATPNVYADQIEWMSRSLHSRANVTLSVHPHNDRGTAIAAAELAQLAGAQRVEGTLFGNGERAGNVDLVVLALNLYSQGIDPMLDFRDLPRIQRAYEEITERPVPERHCYAGTLSTMAFSGTHQAAIRACLEGRTSEDPWDVAYLPIDFKDIGREYIPIVINSQSGKNGVAYALRHNFGLEVPKKMEGEIMSLVQAWCDRTGTVIPPETILSLFNTEFVDVRTPILFTNFESSHVEVDGQRLVCASLMVQFKGMEHTLVGHGNGPIDATVAALSVLDITFNVRDFKEHSLDEGSSAKAIAYVQVEMEGSTKYGVGVHTDSEEAAIRAVISGVNRHLLAC